MKVHELQALLATMPPDATIQVMDGEDNCAQITGLYELPNHEWTLLVSDNFQTSVN